MLKGIALLGTANFNVDCDYSVLAWHLKVLTMMYNIVSVTVCIQIIYNSVAMSVYTCMSSHAHTWLIHNMQA
jgi:hypothetical protein